MSYRTPTSQLANCGLECPSASCLRRSGNAIVCKCFTIKFQTFFQVWFYHYQWMTDWLVRTSKGVVGSRKLLWKVEEVGEKLPDMMTRPEVHVHQKLTKLPPPFPVIFLPFHWFNYLPLLTIALLRLSTNYHQKTARKKVLFWLKTADPNWNSNEQLPRKNHLKFLHKQQ